MSEGRDETGRLPTASRFGDRRGRSPEDPEARAEANQRVQRILARRPKVRVTWRNGRTGTYDRNLWDAGVIDRVDSDGARVVEVALIPSGEIIYPPPEHKEQQHG
jgi:hypothetical protein